ncbi:MAG: TonB family protein [bacterium]|nr:TonB family protein [bacterium]
MYQHQTLDASLLISMIIHSLLALVFSFISVQHGIISSPRIFEVAMVEIPQKVLTMKPASLSPMEKTKPPVIQKALASSLEKRDKTKIAEGIVDLPREKIAPGKIDEKIMVREKVFEPKATSSLLKEPHSIRLPVEPAVKPMPGFKKDIDELLPDETRLDKTSISKEIFIPKEAGQKASPPDDNKTESGKGIVTPFPIAKGTLKGRGIKYSAKINLPEEKEREAIPRQGEFKLWVSPDGSVEKVEIEKTTGDSKIDDLVKKTFFKWRFEALPPSEQKIDWGLVPVKISFK